MRLLVYMWRRGRPVLSAGVSFESTKLYSVRDGVVVNKSGGEVVYEGW